MNNNNIAYAFSYISVLIIMIMYFIVIKNYLKRDINEKFNLSSSTINHDNSFKYMASNTSIMYNNTGELPWNRHMINSSIPYDINIKKEAENVYYFEYNNETYTNKLKELFKSNCEEIIIAVEGNKWEDWVNPKKLKDTILKNKLLTYYYKIMEFIEDKLKNSAIMDLQGYDKKVKIQIVHDIMLRYRINSNDNNYIMFDIDMILYRSGKFQGKHVKLVIITDGNVINVILAKIIGVISEDKIVLHPYHGYDFMNSTKFNQFIPMKYGTVDTDVKTSRDNTFELSDEYMNSEIEKIMYNKLLAENIPEDIDISNNNYNI